MLTNDEIDRLLEENEYPRYDGLAITRFAHAVEREAYKRAAAECRLTQGDPATNQQYNEGCRDCAAAIEALGSEK